MGISVFRSSKNLISENGILIDENRTMNIRI